MDEKIVGSLELIRSAVEGFSPVALASSLSSEDMVLLDMIARAKLDVSVFTLDTGRLPQETYDVMQMARSRYYQVPFHIYAPNTTEVEAYVAANGPNGFYESVELRKACCRVRKVNPLRRALAGKRAWITGQRRAHSQGRATLDAQEWDAANDMVKFNPLVDWSNEELALYIKTYDVPINVLHGKGYPSLGCAPCTRAIRAGEDLRAGRWWWENPEFSECGLHQRVVAA
jgi:phosphoadenosine phosphosulfate reductase